MRVAFRADGHWSIRMEIRTSDTHPGDSSCDFSSPSGWSIRADDHPSDSLGLSVRADSQFVRLNSLARADR